MMNDNKTGIKVRKQTGRLTLNEYLDFWLNGIKSSIKPNTYTAYYGHIHNHIDKSDLSSMRLKEIRSVDIQNFVQSLQRVNDSKSHKALSGKTVRLIYDMLKTALNSAVDYEYITKNPCYKIRLPRHTQRETRIISIKEQSVLERAIAESNDKKSFGVQLCLYTGIRLGELCALKWSDIDFENQELTVQRTLGRITLHDDEGNRKTVISEDTPKTKKSMRSIPLPDFLLKALKARKKESNSSYVVSMKDGRRVLPRTMQDVFKSLLKKSGLKRTNFHALRHTFATRAIELNVNVCAVSEILGHSNISITISRYIHALKEQKLDAARYFDKFYNCRQSVINDCCGKEVKPAVKKPIIKQKDLANKKTAK